MLNKIGIVQETKNEWERRVPLVPNDISQLVADDKIEFHVQPSPRRIFPDAQFSDAGASLTEDLGDCDVIIGIKEIKPDDLIAEKVYMYFSHTIKGQDYNMPMLKRLMELNCTLIDYERIMNDKGQRLIFFSYHAGLAGMIETLWSYGQRMKVLGVSTPFETIQQTYHYSSLEAAKQAVKKVAEEIRTNGVPAGSEPFVVGITGYGNVARGAQEILDLLPVTEITPEELLAPEFKANASNKTIYKVIFKESHMVEPVSPSEEFNLQEYYTFPDRYRGVFEKYLPHLTMLVNATFWDTQYPRHVTIEAVKQLYAESNGAKLCVIGDISCDIDGGVELTVKGTDPGNPVFVYDYDKTAGVDGFEGNGPVIMAVDILPSELPADASEYFSNVLKTLMPALAKSELTDHFADWQLIPELKNATIVYRGKLAPDYQYLEDYL
jgi:saccharopine dehydrogenase (NAD+, L-lysine-forming)